VGLFLLVTFGFFLLENRVEKTINYNNDKNKQKMKEKGKGRRRG